MSSRWESRLRKMAEQGWVVEIKACGPILGLTDDGVRWHIKVAAPGRRWEPFEGYHRSFDRSLKMAFMQAQNAGYKV